MTAVAGNATNINSVAGNATNINTVAGANANINAVATNIADVNNFADTYFWVRVRHLIRLLVTSGLTVTLLSS